MNIFKKFYPNVFIAECDERHNKGEIIELTTKYNKDVNCEVYNLIKEGTNGKFYYSIARVEESNYAERKADKYSSSASLHNDKSNQWYSKSKEGRDFLILAEPIKIGHHSESRHRALLKRNDSRMRNSIEEMKIAEEKERKAEYWEKKAKVIDLSMPMCLNYFVSELEKATIHHQGLKNGTIAKEHNYSLTYANNKVKDLKKKVDIAKILWS